MISEGSFLSKPGIDGQFQGPSKKVLDFCGRRVIGRNFLSVEVHFYRETGITRQLSKSQALKVYSLKTPGIEGSGNGARNFLIEGEWRGSRGPKFLPRAARQPAALPDHIPGPGTACLCAPSPLGALGGPACPRRRAGDGGHFARRAPCPPSPPLNFYPSVEI